MRTLILISLLCCMTAVSAEIYRWTDANGKEVYGDEPPEHARSLQRVELPVLTVADGFKRQSKPNDTVPKEDQLSQELATNPDQTKAETLAKDEPIDVAAYEKFSILAPGTDELVRSNNGALKVKLEIQPALKAGHGVVLYVDGRQVGAAQTNSLEIQGVERGEHSIFAVLHDAQDSILANTEAVNFKVMRASVIR